MAKLSISKIEKIMKETFVPEVCMEWNGEKLNIRHTLTLEEMLTFADSVTNSCFGEDGAYLPELKDFAIRVATLLSYADISLPEDPERKYAICYRTDLFRTVQEHIELDQYNEMIHAIDEKIEHMAESNVQMIYRKADEAAEAISGMVEKVGALFENIDEQDLRNLVSAIGSGGLDEQKIVQAYLGAQKDQAE